MALPVFGTAPTTVLKPTLPFGTRVGYYVDATTPTITELANVKGGSIPDPVIGVVSFGNLTKALRRKIASQVTTPGALTIITEYDPAEYLALETIKKNQINSAHADYGKSIYFIFQFPLPVGESAANKTQKKAFYGVLTELQDEQWSDEGTKIHTVTMTLDVIDVVKEFI